MIETTATECKICNNKESNKIVIVDEWKSPQPLVKYDEYKYLECGYCGCLQFVDNLPDLTDYYDNEQYYSFREHNSNIRRMRETLGITRDKIYLTKFGGGGQENHLHRHHTCLIYINMPVLMQRY